MPESRTMTTASDDSEDRRMGITANRRLREERLRRGWSEQDLADRIQQWEYEHGDGHDLPVDRNYVHRWETGKRGVSAFYAVRLEGVFGRSRLELGLVDRRTRQLVSSADARSVDGREPAPPAAAVGDAMLGASPESGSAVQRRAFNRVIAAGGLAAAGIAAEGITPWSNTGDLERTSGASMPVQVQRIRDRLMRYASIDGIPTGEPVPLGTLRSNVTNAWRAFQEADYSSLASQLPVLIDSSNLVEQACEPSACSRAGELLSETLQLTAIPLLKQGDSNLGWVAADRSMLAAERAENPLTVASAARILAYALLGARHFDKAKDLCLRVADHLEQESRLGSPGALSAYGALVLKAVMAAAMQDDRATTTELLKTARRTADRLGHDGNHLWTAFGPTNVAVHSVSAAVALGDAGVATQEATRVHLDRLPVLERRAHHLIDLSRAFGQRSKNDQSLSSLLEAEQLAPEEVRVSPEARALVAELLHRNVRRVPELRALARRVQVAA